MRTIYLLWDLKVYHRDPFFIHLNSLPLLYFTRPELLTT